MFGVEMFCFVFVFHFRFLVFHIAVGRNGFMSDKLDELLLRIIL